ncbi:hypothetical protein, partial [Pseudomonas syringae group genomosp. 7]|uniref:hypothetical protein n=1 Tax=Pseudomonas syringae group genomosp. 7 TaxID=251699 RepID=UPI00376FA057
AYYCTLAWRTLMTQDAKTTSPHKAKAHTPERKTTTRKNNITNHINKKHDTQEQNQKDNEKHHHIKKNER